MAAPPAATDRKAPLGATALKWTALGLLALSFSLGGNLVRPTIRGLQVEGDIVRRSVEYREQIRANTALEQEIVFLRTEPGRQWAVNKYLGRVKPGQEVGRAVEEPAPPAPTPSKRERVEAWIAGTEDRGARGLREAGEIGYGYAGLRAPDNSPNDRNLSAKRLSKIAKPQASRATTAATEPAIKTTSH